MSTGSAKRPVAKPQGTAYRVRVIIFRVVATLAGFSCGGLVLMASAHWVLLQPDQEFRLDRFMEPTLILASGATSAELLRWAAVLDLSAY